MDQFDVLDGYFEDGGQRQLECHGLGDVKDKILNGEDVIVRISGYCVNTKYIQRTKQIDTPCLPRSLSMDV